MRMKNYETTVEGRHTSSCWPISHKGERFENENVMEIRTNEN